MAKKRPPPPRSKHTDQDHTDTGFKPFLSLKKMRESLGEEKSKAPDQPPPKRASKAPAPPLPEGDDALSMRRLMSGVTPLGGRPQRIPRSKELDPADRASRSSSRAEQAQRVEAQARAEDEAVHAHLRQLVDGAARKFEVIDDGKRVEGRRTELRTEVLRKLRHGLFPVDARIDLHGMSSREAREQLERFLADQRARGERCVLVVHGKGEHSPRGMGVLRGEIGAWLSQGPASAHVAAFATAGAGDGGEGAVYVLLTR
jgi:DNA-nicking Smr family endonuclease